MYIKYLQIALNYRTRCRLPRTAKCIAYHQERAVGGGQCKCKWKWEEKWEWDWAWAKGHGEKWSNIVSASNCCLLHIQFEWMNRPDQPSPAQHKQSGWTEACLSIPLTNGISQSQFLSLSRSLSIYLSLSNAFCGEFGSRRANLFRFAVCSRCGYQWPLHTVHCGGNSG